MKNIGVHKKEWQMILVFDAGGRSQGCFGTFALKWW